MQKTKIYFIAIIGMMLVITGCKEPVINTLKPTLFEVVILDQKADSITLQFTREYLDGFPGEFKSLRLNGAVIPLTLRGTKVEFTLKGLKNVSEAQNLVFQYRLGGNVYDMLFYPNELVFRAL